jgi:hypothetical protein
VDFSTVAGWQVPPELPAWTTVPPGVVLPAEHPAGRQDGAG